MTSGRECCVVGIAGGSASGKSMFTRVLVEALTDREPGLRIRVLHTDGYFRLGSPEMPHLVLSTNGEVLPDFNRPDSVDLDRLIADLDAAILGNDAADILIVEGLMVLHLDAVRERLDLRLFVELDADTRALRRLVRNLEHHGDPLSDQSAGSIAAYYLESAKVGHERYIEPSRAYADLIVRGDADFSRVAPMVATVVVEMRPQRCLSTTSVTRTSPGTRASG